MPATPTATAPAVFPPEPTTRAADHDEPAAWRPKEWRRKVPIGSSKFYLEIQAGRIEVVKVGSATLVTTSPKEYLASLRDERAG